jgi:hypothetical protein
MDGVDLEHFEWAGAKLRCLTCGMTGYPPQVFLGFVYPWWGQRHIASHPWDCSRCDRAFTTASGLSTHQRMSHGFRSSGTLPMR